MEGGRPHSRVSLQSNPLNGILRIMAQSGYCFKDCPERNGELLSEHCQIMVQFCQMVQFQFVLDKTTKPLIGLDCKGDFRRGLRKRERAEIGSGRGAESMGPYVMCALALARSWHDTLSLVL